MNERYRQGVAGVDRRHALMVRVLSLVSAAALMVVALWSAGFPPNQWWATLQRWQSTEQGATQPAIARVPTAPPNQEVATVAPAQPNADALRGTDSSVSTTPLPLYLVATTPGRNKNEGTARIGTSLENPQTYAGGALLANGARLSEVHQDHVVLTRGRSSARLYLHQRDPRTAPADSTSALLTVSAEPARPPQPVKIGEGLTDYLRPSPVYDGEILRGYEVYPGPRAGVFAQLGLQPGDVITSINDTPLTEPVVALDLLTQIMHGVAVVATIDRKNSERRITLDGALISADQEKAKETSATAMSRPDMPGS